MPCHAISLPRLTHGLGGMKPLCHPHIVPSRRSPLSSVFHATATPSMEVSTWLCSSQGTTQPRSGPPRWLAMAHGQGSSSFTSWGQVPAGDRGTLTGTLAGREWGSCGVGELGFRGCCWTMALGNWAVLLGWDVWGQGMLLGQAAEGESCCWTGKMRG